MKTTSISSQSVSTAMHLTVSNAQAEISKLLSGINQDKHSASPGDNISYTLGNPPIPAVGCVS